MTYECALWRPGLLARDAVLGRFCADLTGILNGCGPLTRIRRLRRDNIAGFL
jgi:hypothetical protein